MQDAVRQGRKAKEELAEVDVNIKQLLDFLRKYSLRVMCLALLVALIAVLISFSLTPIYKAKATVLIEAEEAKLVSIEEVYGLGSSNREYLQTQFEMIKSKGLAERVARELDLVNNDFFQKKVKEKSLLSSIVGGLKSFIGLENSDNEVLEREPVELIGEYLSANLSVSPVRKTQLVNLSFALEDKKLATKIVNAFSQFYIQNQLDAKAEIAQKALELLSSRLDGLQNQLEKSERSLANYRQKEGLIDLEGVTTLVSKQLNELTSQIVEVRRQKAELAALNDQVVGNDGQLALDKLASVSSILKDTLVQRFKELEAEADAKVEELAQRYGPLHPEMLGATADLDVARKKYREQLRDVAEGIAQEYAAVKRKEKRLLKEMASAKRELQTIRTKEFELNNLERSVNTNRQLYNTFFKRVKETTETIDLATANARIVDVAKVPLKPIKPRKALIVVLATLLAAMAGFGLALLMEVLDNTFKSSDDIESKLNLPLVGLLPALKGGKKGEDLNLSRVFHDTENKKFSESIRSIRTGLQLAGIDKPLKITVVTSSVPGEGKSTLSMNLAQALGLNERVLLIDADMRRPSVGKKLGFAVGTPGLANLIAGNTSFDGAIQHMDGIDVILAGAVPPNPLELLSTKKFTDILAELGERYDRIVIDSPPTQAVSDALLLGTHADAVLYVVKANSTSVNLVKNGVGDLLQAGAPLTGVVLNQVDLNKQSYYNYSYAGYYDSDDSA